MKNKINLPFSRIIQQKEFNQTQNINLIIGYQEAWSLAFDRIQCGLPALVLEPTQNLKNISLPVNTRDVLIIDFGIQSIDFIENLFLILEFYGAKLIYVVSPLNKKINGMWWQRDE